ncbi:universal stress protein [Nocardia aurantiaca]|uniref:Universal stress protein n=1 Tax=Nocardia aurantiaca TaxID=2675850 RepID=A0A6I3L151_9NOCA|nr:universal stress protein [Nocardia aurantiaca]MTE14326.1 universal stress protein [Nocardia aurantiaca]
MTEHTAPRSDPNPPVIVAVDGSAVSYQAVAWAALHAARHGCPLHIVTSICAPVGPPPTAVLNAADIASLELDGERIVGEATHIASETLPGEGVEMSSEVTTEPIISRLIELSRDARIMVLGSRGLGALRRGLLGSVSTAVTHYAHCPVAVIHTTAAADPVSARQPVLVGVDGTSNSVAALEFAFAEASLRKTGLTALHAWSDVSGPYLPMSGWEAVEEQEHATFGEEMAGYAERYPDVPVRRILVKDRPVRSLLDESENAQLVVVGSHGRGGFTGMLLGSTSNALLHSVDCPIVIVRGT